MARLRVPSAIALLAAAFFACFAESIAAPAGPVDPEKAQEELHEHHELPRYAVPLISIGTGGIQLVPNETQVEEQPGFVITNSMVATWIVALLLIGFAQYATRDIKDVPEGAQNFWEWLVESLYSFLEGVIGRDLVRKTFWFFATIFVFILFTNWFGLIPGIGSIGWGPPGAEGQPAYIAQPLLRGSNADLNMTLAMAIVFFLCWIYWAFRTNGAGGMILHIFGPKGRTTGALKLLMVVVFFAVGVLEIISILFRPVSLSFRLYGNIYAGESLLETMAMMGGAAFGWLIPIPFYFMELLVGLVQALVFMLLTAVFTLLICSHHEEEHPSH